MLARESRHALEDALKKLQKEKGERKQREEAEKREKEIKRQKEELAKQQEREKERQRLEQEKIETEKRFIEETLIFRQKWQEDLSLRDFFVYEEYECWINEMEHSLIIWKMSYETLSYTPDFFGESYAFREAARLKYRNDQKKKRNEELMLQEILRKEAEQKERQKEEAFWDRKLNILNKEKEELPDITENEFEEVRNQFWKKYINLPAEENEVLFERRYFPNGLPSWFFSKKLKWQDKQAEILRKQRLVEKGMRNTEKAKKPDQKEDQWEQLSLL